MNQNSCGKFLSRDYGDHAEPMNYNFLKIIFKKNCLSW